MYSRSASSCRWFAFACVLAAFLLVTSGLSVRGIYHGWILRLGLEYFQRKGLADFP